MTAELVSIVIPCFNEERFVGAAIDSALAQTHPRVEIVVVDDGSTDGTVDVARSFGDEVRVVQQENGGLSNARNTGARAAKGTYLTFLDADDQLLPAFVEKTTAVLDQEPEVAFAYTQFRYYGRETQVSKWPPYDAARLTVGNYISSTALIRASVLRDVGFDERMRTGYEDWDFFLSLAGRGLSGRLVDEPLFLYQKHDARDRLTDQMIDPANKRRVKLFIMRKHLRQFGLPAYAHFFVHHVKETVKDRVRAR